MSDTDRAVTMADYSPATGHLLDCAVTRVGSDVACQSDCTNALFAIAQDQERVIARVQGVVDMWQPSNPHPTQGCVPCSLRDQVIFALDGHAHD